MKVLITGATGFIGRSLTKKLVSMGHQVVCVSRDQEKAKSVFGDKSEEQVEFYEWDLMQAALPASAFTEVSGLIHLLGESIDGYWTDSKKKKILESREISSRNLLLNVPETMKAIVTASAQGIYGDRGDEILTEKSSEGEGFLAEVCRVWEKEFHSLQQSPSKSKVVIVRIGLVLDRNGGALKKLIRIFSKNVGATLGTGKQWMSWISLDDLVSIFIEALQNQKLQGVVNAVQPHPVRNEDFTTILCKVLNVIQWPRVPVWVLKPLVGEMSALVLQSQRVRSEQLKKINFSFQDTDLESFLQRQLNVANKSEKN